MFLTSKSTRAIQLALRLKHGRMPRILMMEMCRVVLDIASMPHSVVHDDVTDREAFVYPPHQLFPRLARAWELPPRGQPPLYYLRYGTCSRTHQLVRFTKDLALV